MPNIDFRQSKSFAKYLESSGWKTELIGKTYIYIFKLPFLGSFIRIPRPKLPISLAKIIKTTKKYNASVIKIEPDASTNDVKLIKDLKKWGFVFDNWSIEPTKTLIIDLKLPEDKLFKNLKPKWRQYVRLAIKSGVKTNTSEDINTFVNLWQINAKNKKHLIERAEKTRVFWQELNSLGKVKILLAQIFNKTIAGAFLIFWGDTVYLWHLAYTNECTNFKPLYLLVWDSILYAKSKGAKYFDFEGIEDPRLPYSQKLQSSFFKKGFGGFEVEYIGSYVKFLKPLPAFIYKLVRQKPYFFRLFYKKLYG